LKRLATRFFSVAISAALLIVLYRSVDVRAIGGALLGADPAWLVVSIAMIVPITLLRALRFLTVAPPGALPGFGEALRLTLVASALNVVVPAKGGDLVKSYFVARRSDTSTGVALAIVVYERLSDLFGLITWCVVGWLVARPQVPGLPSRFWIGLGAFGALCGIVTASSRTGALLPAIIRRLRPPGKLRKLADLAAGWPNLLRLMRGRRRLVLPLSVVLWLTHLFQIWLFTVALSVSIPFTVCASLGALALMAGQLPLTIAGIGTRDLALVVLMRGYMAPEVAAAMGILMATRNLLPPLMGTPLMRPYLSSAVEEARRWRREAEAG
jgi:uncharacterized membrane protein YbhN (UPF0104 family)